MDVFILILLSVLIGTIQCFTINDNCTVFPKGNNSYIDNITVKTSCRNGTILWNYPTGKTMIHFLFGGKFSVCLVNYISENVLTAVDMSGHCYKVLPKISKTPVCVDALGGEVVIRFQTPQQKCYFAIVNYYIADHKGIHC